MWEARPPRDSPRVSDIDMGSEPPARDLVLFAFIQQVLQGLTQPSYDGGDVASAHKAAPTSAQRSMRGTDAKSRSTSCSASRWGNSRLAQSRLLRPHGVDALVMASHQTHTVGGHWALIDIETVKPPPSSMVARALQSAALLSRALNVPLQVSASSAVEEGSISR